MILCHQIRQPFKNTIFYLITAHTPSSAQFLRLQITVCVLLSKANVLNFHFFSLNFFFLFFICAFVLKILNGMTNSVDPHQTAQSGAV